MQFGNRKNILDDLSSSVLSQFKQYHPSGNLKFDNLDIFQSLKFRILMETILLISLKLNLTPNTFGCHWLTPNRPAMQFANRKKKCFRGSF